LRYSNETRDQRRRSSIKGRLECNEILVEQEVKMPEMVSVEINGQILRRGEFDTTVLNEGDKVEFLYFMGGGSADE